MTTARATSKLRVWVGVDGKVAPLQGPLALAS